MTVDLRALYAFNVAATSRDDAWIGEIVDQFGDDQEMLAAFVAVGDALDTEFTIETDFGRWIGNVRAAFDRHYHDLALSVGGFRIRPDESNHWMAMARALSDSNGLLDRDRNRFVARWASSAPSLLVALRGEPKADRAMIEAFASCKALYRDVIDAVLPVRDLLERSGLELNTRLLPAFAQLEGTIGPGFTHRHKIEGLFEEYQDTWRAFERDQEPSDWDQFMRDIRLDEALYRKLNRRMTDPSTAPGLLIQSLAHSLNRSTSDIKQYLSYVPRLPPEYQRAEDASLGFEEKLGILPRESFLDAVRNSETLPELDRLYWLNPNY